MHRYIRCTILLPFSVMKVCLIKMCHPRAFTCSPISVLSPHTEITLDRGAKLEIGKKFRMRDGAKIRVRTGAVCIIGKNIAVNSNNMIACYERIEIGDNVQFSPNVQIYDHDHDFRVDGGIGLDKFKTSPIVIGKNVWIGANTVILRGTTIGDNSVIGAGSVIKGNIPANSVVVQKRTTEFRTIGI